MLKLQNIIRSMLRAVFQQEGTRTTNGRDKEKNKYDLRAKKEKAEVEKEKMNQRLRELLIKHEGLRLAPYQDTVGKLTIGVGRNLQDNGISNDEAMLMLDNDIARCLADAKRFDWFESLNEARKIVILSMLFNLGLTRFLGFRKMIGYLEQQDYDHAALEMLDSRWAKQVKGRAHELADMMRMGEDVWTS